LVVAGAKAVQTAIIPPHAAIRTVFAAEIGNLDHGPHKHSLAELPARHRGGAFVKGRLRRALQSEV
jgi:hypothetical protein